MPLNALFLLATLKPTDARSFSHTRVLSDLLIEKLREQTVASEVITLIDHHIPPGTKTDLGTDKNGLRDEWPMIVEKMLAADILIFATPIWWGSPSSLMQRVVERLDELNVTLEETGSAGFLNKVGGMVITGEEDGTQHVIGILSNFMAWNAITIPPAPSLSYLGSYDEKTPEALLARFKSQETTTGMADTLARNLASVARALKVNPIPAQDKNAQYLR
jgi:multimeric flavodoxin WrbA